jgi:hypothetical protein
LTSVLSAVQCRLYHVNECSASRGVAGGGGRVWGAKWRHITRAQGERIKLASVVHCRQLHLPTNPSLERPRLIPPSAAAGGAKRRLLCSRWLLLFIMVVERSVYVLQRLYSMRTGAHRHVNFILSPKTVYFTSSQPLRRPFRWSINDSSSVPEVRDPAAWL